MSHADGASSGRQAQDSPFPDCDPPHHIASTGKILQSGCKRMLCKCVEHMLTNETAYVLLSEKT